MPGVSDLVETIHEQFEIHPPDGGDDVRGPVPDWIFTDLPHQPEATPFEDFQDLGEVSFEQPGEGESFTWVEGVTVDALAYYLPFHFHPSSWGIHVRASGLRALAGLLHRGTAGSYWERAQRAASRILDRHERYHHACELAASLGEIAELDSGEEWYRPYFHKRDPALVEEALANVKALKSLGPSGVSDYRSAAEKWMATQPDGYNRFPFFINPEEFLQGQRYLARNMKPVGLSSLPSSWPGEMLWPREQHLKDCPVRVLPA